MNKRETTYTLLQNIPETVKEISAEQEISRVSYPLGYMDTLFPRLETLIPRLTDIASEKDTTCLQCCLV
jgi:hypothetical protein